MIRWYSVKDVCEMARVNKTTFYRWQKASDKPTLVPLPKLLPMVRFSQEDVEAYLNALGGATGGVIIPSNENNQNLQGAA